MGRGTEGKKAESPATKVGQTFLSAGNQSQTGMSAPPLRRKAYSLDGFSASLRRALPYANMRKAFSLQSGEGIAALHTTAGSRRYFV
jgi:hypothetical protein